MQSPSPSATVQRSTSAPRSSRRPRSRKTSSKGRAVASRRAIRHGVSPKAARGANSDPPSAQSAPSKPLLGGDDVPEELPPLTQRSLMHESPALHVPLP